MTYRIGVRREDIDKRGEMRVAITPKEAQWIVEQGHSLVVQSALHPETNVRKRAFEDTAYTEAGAVIQDDLRDAQIIFGLKEIKKAEILPKATYLFFSHTHKGQTKNRLMLKTLVERECTLIDYELITNENNARLLTAFTYFAGYGGMIDSLWTFGQRMQKEGVEHPFAAIPQSIEKGDLGWFKQFLATDVKDAIETHGTPDTLPPFINCILGCGKTSKGAQDIYDLLPSETITLEQLQDVYAQGSRNKVYKLVLEVYEMYRLKADAATTQEEYAALDNAQKFAHYVSNPGQYESNLDQILPYISMLMNCILWSPAFPRVLPNTLMSSVETPMRVIGDITCDPNGAIEFSKETWVDAPVYTYTPSTHAMHDGITGQDVQVMAVTNLPCAFSADASSQFASEVGALLPGLLTTDFAGSFEESGLPDALARATILWKGQFTPQYAYMQEYVDSVS